MEETNNNTKRVKTTSTTVEEGEDNGEKEEKEFELPLASINRLIKMALPEGAVVSKDAKHVRCLFVFFF